MNKGFITYLICIALLVFFHCTKDRIAGPATEEGNPILAGTVVNPSAKPVANAVIQAYRSPVISDSTLFIPQVQPVAMTTTDKTGKFAFFELTSGIYIIECIDADNNNYAVSEAVIVVLDSSWSDSALTVTLDTMTLKPAGSIRGIVTRGGILASQTNQTLDDGFIQVMLLEIDREDVSRQNGSYELGNVPEGIYTLVFKADDFFTAYRDSVRVESGKTTIVDTTTLQRIPWVAPPKPKNLVADYDTANGTVTLAWEPVIVDNLLGYAVERREEPLQSGVVFTTTDTVYTDTVTSIASGTNLYYVVRAINESFMESANEGPVEVVTKQGN